MFEGAEVRVTTTKDEAAGVRLKEYHIPEMKSTALPLLVVLGSLCLWWPSLCVPLSKWALGLVGVVGVLIGLAIPCQWGVKQSDGTNEIYFLVTSSRPPWSAESSESQTLRSH